MREAPCLSAMSPTRSTEKPSDLIVSATLLRGMRNSAAPLWQQRSISLL